MPYWQNHFLRANARGALTGRASTNASRFYDKGYVRLQDFVDRHGSFPTPSLCVEILENTSFPSPAKRSAAAGFFARQVGRLLNLSLGSTPSQGLHRPADLCAAAYGWSFRGVDFLHGRNHEFYHILHRLPAITRLSHFSLGIASEPDWAVLWRRERSLDRDLLPVLADINYRLQHNVLNVRLKYRHRNSDILCVHGCGVVEDAQHLFWVCPIAQAAWDAVLTPFRDLVAGDLTWAAVVYLQGLLFMDSAISLHKSHNLLRVFNVLRCSVLYVVWLHRNDCLWNGTASDSTFVIQRTMAYTRLHLGRLRQGEVPRLASLCELWLPFPNPMPPEDTLPSAG
ncbi:uncharacterized protein CCR75_008537 [Bremia lactucae]|uniref:Reverse transcriptase zinc-binding domain-containing protein n=1 Tax=Bremia lactucae TaxID=4779 RepID=A0A976FQC2_BRELC|nr:hypothetical protein CCR75_008537 [Bremia lactucae]